MRTQIMTILYVSMFSVSLMASSAALAENKEAVAIEAHSEISLQAAPEKESKPQAASEELLDTKSEQSGELDSAMNEIKNRMFDDLDREGVSMQDLSSFQYLGVTKEVVKPDVNSVTREAIAKTDSKNCKIEVKDELSFADKTENHIVSMHSDRVDCEKAD